MRLLWQEPGQAKEKFTWYCFIKNDDLSKISACDPSVLPSLLKKLGRRETQALLLGDISNNGHADSAGIM